MEDITERIKRVRGRLTQKDFAAKINTAQSTVQKWENGESLPGAKYLESIYREFRIDITWLLTGQGNPYIEDSRPVEGEGRGGGTARELRDDGGLYGRTARHEVEGEQFTVTTFEPRERGRPTGVDRFARAVGALRHVYDAGDQLLVAALEANLWAFQRAARQADKLTVQDDTLKHLTETLKKLEAKCDQVLDENARLRHRLTAVERDREMETIADGDEDVDAEPTSNAA